MYRQLSCLAVLTTLLLAGCAGIEHRSETIPKRPLPAVQKSKPTAQLLWSNNIGSGVAGRDAKLNLAMTPDLLVSGDMKGNLFALNRQNGQVRWRIKTPFSITSGPTILQNVVIVGTRDANVLAYRLEDGKLLWKTSVPGEVLAAPQGFQDTIYVNTLDGSLIALSLKEGRERWRYSLDTPSIVLRRSSSPLVAGNYIVVGFANGRLVALHRMDGSVAWEKEISIPKGRSDIQRMGDVSADPVINNGMVYAVSYQGRLAALSLQTGNALWEKEMSSYSGLTVSGSLLFVSDAKGHLFAVDRQSGRTVWEQAALEGRRLTKPVILGNQLVVGDEDGYLHWFSQADGAYLNRLQIDAKGIDMSPVLSNNQLYVLGRGGKIAVYHLKASASPAE